MIFLMLRDLGEVAPHAGAWIEITRNGGDWRIYLIVAPHAGAWIEMAVCVWMPEATGSHPMRVRGLKSGAVASVTPHFGRTPCGCVD